MAKCAIIIITHCHSYVITKYNRKIMLWAQCYFVIWHTHTHEHARRERERERLTHGQCMCFSYAVTSSLNARFICANVHIYIFIHLILTYKQQISFPIALALWANMHAIKLVQSCLNRSSDGMHCTYIYICIGAFLTLSLVCFSFSPRCLHFFFYFFVFGFDIFLFGYVQPVLLSNLVILNICCNCSSLTYLVAVSNELYSYTSKFVALCVQASSK